MKMPCIPPDVKDALSSKNGKLSLLSDEVIGYVQKFNEEYLHWEDVRYRDTGTIDPQLIWAAMKLSRNNTAQKIDLAGLKMEYNFPERFLYELQKIDVRSSSNFAPLDSVDEKRRAVYSVGSVMEESIASSQIEGAATTTKVAKTMLRENKHPKNKSEQMILNNYNAMKFIKTQTDKPLSPELIKNIHKIVTAETLEDEYVGKFRKDDGIAVADALTGETFYEPVEHSRISPMIKALCKFVNKDKPFIHPVVKGIIIHFAVAYIHPFQDGNGRVSRALFYWYTMKNGYGIMEYLSLSKSIKDHRGRYDRAYLLSETDGNDLTYFISYNLDMLDEALETFISYLNRKLKEQNAATDKIAELDLNIRQKAIVSDMMCSNELISVHSVSNKYQVSMNTARSDISKLVSLGILEKDCRDVNRIMYRYAGKGLN